MYISATAALYFNCNHFGMTTLKVFVKIIIFRNGRRVLQTLSKLYDVPVGFVTHPPSFVAVYCIICGRRRVAVARYRIICIVLVLRRQCIILYQRYDDLINDFLFCQMLILINSRFIKTTNETISCQLLLSVIV